MGMGNESYANSQVLWFEWIAADSEVIEAKSR
jgi:hypothetical protein